MPKAIDELIFFSVTLLWMSKKLDEGSRDTRISYEAKIKIIFLTIAIFACTLNIVSV